MTMTMMLNTKQFAASADWHGMSSRATVVLFLLVFIGNAIPLAYGDRANGSCSRREFGGGISGNSCDNQDDTFVDSDSCWGTKSCNDCDDCDIGPRSCHGKLQQIERENYQHSPPHLFVFKLFLYLCVLLYQ